MEAEVLFLQVLALMVPLQFAQSIGDGTEQQQRISFSAPDPRAAMVDNLKSIIVYSGFSPDYYDQCGVSIISCEKMFINRSEFEEAFISSYRDRLASIGIQIESADRQSCGSDCLLVSLTGAFGYSDDTTQYFALDINYERNLGRDATSKLRCGFTQTSDCIVAGNGGDPIIAASCKGGRIVFDSLLRHLISVFDRDIVDRLLHKVGK